jgi:hypothetical protein
VHSFSKQILDSTLPKEARSTLIDILRETGEAKETLHLLENVEDEMKRYASRESFSNNSPLNPFQYESRCVEFEGFIREVLALLGNRLNLNRFTPVPLKDPTIHDNLAQASLDAGFAVEHGYCDAVYVDTFGRATAHRAHIVRLSIDDVFADFQESSDQFYVVRFIALNPKTPSAHKMTVFTRMVKILLRTAIRVSGKPATSNDACVWMPSSGDWRFVKEPSPLGEITRLQRFWLRCGGVPERLFVPSSPYVIFLRDADAVAVTEEFKRQRPTSVSPYALLSRFSHFHRDTTAKLLF